MVTFARLKTSIYQIGNLKSLGKSGIVFVVTALSLSSCSDPEKAHLTDLQNQGNAAYRSNNFEDAVKAFDEATRLAPRSAANQYNLGMSCLKTKRMKEAALALSKVVVMTGRFDPLQMKAEQVLLDNFKLQPMCCLRNEGLVRWDKSAMPLRIYITSGNVPPSNFTNRTVEQFEVNQLGEMVRGKNLATEMPVSKWFDPAYIDCVKKGISAWSWGKDESLFSVEFTDELSEADIVVLWADSLHGYAGWNYYPDSQGVGKDPAILLLSLYSKKNLNEEQFRQSLTTTAAHEFGHILGVEHAITKNLLMSTCNIVKESESDSPIKISDSEKETVRALYGLPADLTLGRTGN